MRPIILFIERLGHLGGLLLCALALISGSLGAWLLIGSGPWNGEALWSPAGMGLGMTHLGLGLVLLLRGLPLLFRGAPPDFRMSDDALRALLSENRPMTLCLDCRTEIVVPPCEYCRQSSTAFDVRTRTDAENARALLGLDAKIELQ